ncbi:hypothetical protein Stsp02_75010 [Streptomyces sp. NBRC 14336]|uniref:hypothetical protein n=1 Tax=Streptomyces sp. NBRC 14336 TaxID=3030992 RepID=UPI0024A3B139|nr:hypothetical protein [Streptomyces sp. NBRC 14336]WBO82346.1 hypothetical protein SBE_006272 [Streptomyces sp. SBE_14.2]GLW51841.1 hypothetical protein Stsp02_75010 [Streptomyces sp. NBRC 14336]
MTIAFLMLARLPEGRFEAFDAYRSDPRRAAAAPLLEASGAAIELLAVRDVGGGSSA